MTTAPRQCRELNPDYMVNDSSNRKRTAGWGISDFTTMLQTMPGLALGFAGQAEPAIEHGIRLLGEAADSIAR